MSFVLAHELYEPFRHTLTILQITLIILQTVPTVDIVSPQWNLFISSHTTLIGLFVQYTLDVLVKIGVVWQSVSVKYSQRLTTRLRRTLREKLSIRISRVFSLLFPDLKHKLDNNIMESGRRSAAYAELFCPGTKQEQHSEKRLEIIKKLSRGGQAHIGSTSSSFQQF